MKEIRNQEDEFILIAYNQFWKNNWNRNNFLDLKHINYHLILNFSFCSIRNKLILWLKFRMSCLYGQSNPLVHISLKWGCVFEVLTYKEIKRYLKQKLYFFTFDPNYCFLRFICQRIWDLLFICVKVIWTKQFFWILTISQQTKTIITLIVHLGVII